MISASETQATCRIAHDLNREAKEYEVIAFAASYEESNCEMDNSCAFTFLDAASLPQVTGAASAVFDQATGEYTVVISGTGFTDTASDVELYLGGQAQTVLSVSATQVVTQVDSLDSGLAASAIDLYFSVGLPNGYTELIDGVKFQPKLISLSTNTGSQAGSIITAVVKGVGVNDQVTLVNMSNS